jgi:hypothetical protein
MKGTPQQLDYASPGMPPRAPRCPPGAGESWLQVLITLAGVVAVIAAIAALFLSQLDHD